MGVSFHMDSAGTPSYEAYGGVTIRDFPGETLVPICCSIWQMQDQVYKSEFKKFVESNFIKLLLLMSLHPGDNLIRGDMFLSIEYKLELQRKLGVF